MSGEGGSRPSKYNFPRFKRGSNIFKGGGGSISFQGSPNFFQGGGGVQMLISIKNHRPCDFPGGSRPPVRPLDPHMYIHCEQVSFIITLKPVLSSHSKRRQKLVFMTNCCLMQVKNIAECCLDVYQERTFCNTFDLHQANICL